jgi:hypothetical protein
VEILTALLLGAALNGARARAETPEQGLEVGQLFPLVAFPALEDGSPRSVADFRGRRLLLQVFASW